jgi:hypothetical protein
MKTTQIGQVEVDSKVMFGGHKYVVAYPVRSGKIPMRALTIAGGSMSGKELLVDPSTLVEVL